MIRITRIQGLWAMMNDHEIIECYDTRQEADEAYEPYRAKAALDEFDRKRSWKSLWDIERQARREAKNYVMDTV